MSIKQPAGQPAPESSNRVIGRFEIEYASDIVWFQQSLGQRFPGSTHPVREVEFWNGRSTEDDARFKEVARAIRLLEEAFGHEPFLDPQEHERKVQRELDMIAAAFARAAGYDDEARALENRSVHEGDGGVYDTTTTKGATP